MTLQPATFDLSPVTSYLLPTVPSLEDLSLRAFQEIRWQKKHGARDFSIFRRLVATPRWVRKNSICQFTYPPAFGPGQSHDARKSRLLKRNLEDRFHSALIGANAETATASERRSCVAENSSCRRYPLSGKLYLDASIPHECRHVHTVSRHLRKALAKRCT